MNTTTKKRIYRRKSSDPLDLHVEQYVKQLHESGQPLGPEAFSTAVQAFSKRFIEAMLQGEMDAHLSGTKPTETTPDEEDAIPSVPASNKRIGFSQKTLKTEFGPLRLDIPRDRQNTFDPLVEPKHNRSFGKIDEQIIAMYARGTCWAATFGLRFPGLGMAYL